MPRRLFIVEEDHLQERPRTPLPEELRQILDGVLAQLIGSNPEGHNLVEFLEARLVHLALEQARYNKSRAARQVGMPRKRLERRLRKYQSHESPSPEPE